MLKVIKQLLLGKSLYIAIGLTIVIAYLSLASLNDLNLSISGKDKFFHALAYMSLGVSWLLAIKPSYTSFKKKSIVLLIVFLYGVLLEYLQYALTTHRQMDVYDVLANSLGVVLSAVVFELFFKRFTSI